MGARWQRWALCLASALLAPALDAGLRAQSVARASRLHALGSSPRSLIRRATSPRSAVALGATEPRALTSDGDFCMWSPEKDVHKLSLVTKGWECTFETGRIARLAGGAVLVSHKDSVVFASACFQAGGTPADFVPLRVDFAERYSSAGKTPGGYIKRERAGDNEILTARLIDRPIRPAFPKGWSQETQICSYLLSYDAQTPPDCMAVCASAAALVISDVPFEQPVACVRVTRGADGEWVLNAPMDAQATSDVSIVIAGTANAMLMIEGFCKFVPEAEIVAACAFGHEAVRHICTALAAWQAAVGKPKATEHIRQIPAQVAQEVERMCAGALEQALSLRSKREREVAFEALKTKVERELTTAYAAAPAPAAIVKSAAELERGDDGVDEPPARDKLDDDEAAASEPPHSGLKSAPRPSRDALELADVQLAFQTLATKTLRQMVSRGGPRPDGRSTTAVRPLVMETAVLPRTHGSALFTRGETQSLATVTLGDQQAEQKYEGVTSGVGAKRFYLQYSFPPFSVGEVGRFGGMPGRREVGHGNLAERALLPALPTNADFPYTVRVESLITMSCGSSSMASVCGGCLALMDAAVPISRPVAGVAMGLLFDDSAAAEHVVLTDIIGLEDALGSMDFKVAGDKDGVTALQLDVKCEGLDVPLLARALAQAHEGRLHILGKMLEAQPGPRTTLPNNVPRIRKLKIDPSMCGAIIGKGGETITAIIADTGVDSIDLAKSEGTVSIMGKTDESIEAAVARIEAVVASASGPRAPRPEVVIGNAYKGEVKSVMPFGIFVELLPGLDGFCHISELSDSFVRKVEEVGLAVGDKIEVQVTSKNEKGQYRVRRILPGQELQPLPAEGEAAPPPKPAKRPSGGGGGARGGPQQRGPPVGAAATAASNVAEEAALSAAMSGLAEDIE